MNRRGVECAPDLYGTFPVKGLWPGLSSRSADCPLGLPQRLGQDALNWSAWCSVAATAIRRTLGSVHADVTAPLISVMVKTPLARACSPNQRNENSIGSQKRSLLVAGNSLSPARERIEPRAREWPRRSFDRSTRRFGGPGAGASPGDLRACARCGFTRGGRSPARMAKSDGRVGKGIGSPYGSQSALVRTQCRPKHLPATGAAEALRRAALPCTKRPLAHSHNFEDPSAISKAVSARHIVLADVILNQSSNGR
jgi:hypothetical protein